MGNETMRNRPETPAEDPLAELARLMGQEDELADLLRQSTPARRPAAPAPQPVAARPSPPPSPSQPYQPRPPAPRTPEPGRPAAGSFAAMAAEVYSEGTPRPAPSPRHSLEDAARDANRSFTRPERPVEPRAPEPRPADPRAELPAHRPIEPRPIEPRPLESRPVEPRAPYVPPRPQSTEPMRRAPVAPPIAPSRGVEPHAEPSARAPFDPAAEPARPAPRPQPRPEAPRAEAPRAEAPRPEAPRPAPQRPEPPRAEAPRAPAPRPDAHEPADEASESRLPSWMARGSAAAPAPAAAHAPAAPQAPVPAAARAPAPAPQPAARPGAPMPGRQFELDEDAYDYGRSAGDYEAEAADRYDGYEAEADVPERRGRRRLLVIGGLLVVAVAATAGAYVALVRPNGTSVRSGEPPVIRAEQGPNKVVPSQPAQPQQASDGQKLIYDRVGGNATTGNEKVVSSEEQPVDVSQAAQPQQPRVIQTPTSSTASSNSGEPKRVRTLTVRADGSIVTDDPGPAPVPASPVSVQSSTQSTASAPIPLNAGTGGPVSTNPTPLSATPSIVPNSNRVATAPVTPAAPRPTTPAATPAAAPVAMSAPAPAGAYVVQIASVRSEAEAQATWRSMQSKYAGILSNQPFSVKRADLGDRGVYYRAQVGSFSGREDAVKLCEALRGAGGDCMVQRN